MKFPRSTITIHIFLIAALLSSCKKNNSNPPHTDQPISISSISVNHGVFSTAVIITGTGFDTIVTNNHIYFNGKLAPTGGYSTTMSIMAIVPKGAGSGNISIVVDGKAASGPLFTYEFIGLVSTFAGSGQSASTDGSGIAASFNEPLGITSDAIGNLYVADKNSDQIRKISSAANVTTIAGTGSAGSVDGMGYQRII